MKTLATVFVAVVLSACATTGQVDLLDFNSRYGQDIPTNPKYKIDLVGVNRYQVVVYQGTALISERTTRASFLKRAGLIAMEGHCVEKGGLLGDFSVQDHVDSFGYINVSGIFVCKFSPSRNSAPTERKREASEIDA